MEITSRGRDGLFPTIYTGEETRLGYWKDLTKQTVRRELLEITEWLGRGPGERVLSDTPSGTRWVDAAEAGNAVFFVPRQGAERDEWERRVSMLRHVQALRRKAEVALEAARSRVSSETAAISGVEAELAAAEKNAEEARSRLAALRAEWVPSLRAMRDRLRITGVRPPSEELADGRRAAVQERQLKQLVAEAERNAGTIRPRLERDLREHRRRLEKARADVRWLEPSICVQVLVGFRTWVNSFLDMQALFTASVANEELRKRPRPLLTEADELEAQLDRV